MTLERTPTNSPSRQPTNTTYTVPAETLQRITSPPIVQQGKRNRMDSPPLPPPQQQNVQQNVLSNDPAINELLRICTKMEVSIAGLEESEKSANVRLNKLEQAQQFTSEHLDKIDNGQLLLMEENKALRERVDILEASLKEVKVQIAQEAKLRDDVDLNNRKYCLELSGLPATPKEDPAKPMEYAKKLLELVGSTSPDTCLDIAHRKMNGGIIIRFKTRTDRNEVYDRRFKLKGVTSIKFGFINPIKGNPIFLNESLSHDRSILLASIRRRMKHVNDELDKDERFKIHTSNGKIRMMDRFRNWQNVTSIKDLVRLHPEAGSPEAVEMDFK